MQSSDNTANDRLLTLVGGPQAVQKFFVGRPEIFGELLLEKVTAAAEDPATTSRTRKAEPSAA